MSNLKTSEAVRTVVAHPRRMAELLRLLEDSDPMTRHRVASALARLADACPNRLLHWVERIQDGLRDDSAYLRWHIVYVLGRVASTSPGSGGAPLESLVVALEDDNKVVRVLSMRALMGIAAVQPRAVEGAFAARKREVPAALAHSIRSSQVVSADRHQR